MRHQLYEVWELQVPTQIAFEFQRMLQELEASTQLEIHKDYLQTIEGTK